MENRIVSAFHKLKDDKNPVVLKPHHMCGTEE
jgi:hypothetical protein